MAAEKHKFGFRKWGEFTLFYIHEKYSQSGVTPNSSAFVGQFTYSMIYTLALIRALTQRAYFLTMSGAVNSLPYNVMSTIALSV